MRLAAAAATKFASTEQGAIINISSALALAPELFSGPYSGAKACIPNLSLSVRYELAPRGVRVQVVLPGATRTAFWGSAGADGVGLPAEMVMDAEELVDAALGPNLSRQHAVPRYRSTAA